LAANLARVLPAGLVGTIDRSTWTPPPVMDLVARLGGVPRADLERTLNLGIGMVAVVAPEAADCAVRRLRSRGVDCWALGQVSPSAATEQHTLGGGAAKGVRGGHVVMVGEHINDRSRG
jgi:phosphoribosylformylglycinamidine cyclo-ligase